MSDIRDLLPSEDLADGQEETILGVTYKYDATAEVWNILPTEPPFATQEDLDGKSDVGHGHIITDTKGLNNILNSFKQAIGELGDITFPEGVSWISAPIYRLIVRQVEGGLGSANGARVRIDDAAVLDNDGTEITFETDFVHAYQPLDNEESNGRFDKLVAWFDHPTDSQLNGTYEMVLGSEIIQEIPDTPSGSIEVVTRFITPDGYVLPVDTEALENWVFQNFLNKVGENKDLLEKTLPSAGQLFVVGVDEDGKVFSLPAFLDRGTGEYNFPGSQAVWRAVQGVLDGNMGIQVLENAVIAFRLYDLTGNKFITGVEDGKRYSGLFDWIRRYNGSTYDEQIFKNVTVQNASESTLVTIPTVNNTVASINVQNFHFVKENSSDGVFGNAHFTVRNNAGTPVVVSSDDQRYSNQYSSIESAVVTASDARVDVRIDGTDVILEVINTTTDPMVFYGTVVVNARVPDIGE